MKKTLFRRILATILVVSMFSTIGLDSFAVAKIKAQNNKLYEDSLDDNVDKDEKSAKNQEITVVKKETDKTVLQLPNGMKRMILHGGEVRFEKDGELVDYDPSLIKVTNTLTSNKNKLTGYKYENKQGNKKHYIPLGLSGNTPILMEYQGYEISFYPVENTDSVTLDKEEVENIYEEKVTIPNKAVYQTKDGSKEFEFVSEISGIKENIILNEKPQTNILKYRLNLKGLTVKKNSLNEGLTLYDKKDNDKIVAGIDAPFMNDATNSAYNDNIKTELKSISNGVYEITMVLDESYLNDSSRQYPVVVDPTVSWTSSSQVYEPYVIKNSPYTDTNFYDSSVKVFAVGDGKQGVFRTYMKIPTLNDTLKGKYIESAELTVYETGSSEKGVEVSAYRASEAWTVSTITWANRSPYDAGAISSFTTSGTTGAAKKLDLTSYVRNTSNGTNTNWGFVLRAKDETTAGGFAQFYNSRYATASKNPKLTVEYYDGPTTPTTAAIEPKYVKQGSTVTAKWAGITSQSLNRIEYRVATYDDAAKAEIDANYVPYSSSTKIGTKGSGSAVITDSKNWPENTYKFVIRGVDNGGIKGTGKGFIFYVDGTLPTISSAAITPTSTADKPATEARPTITWKDAKDTFLKQVEYNVNGGAYKIAGTAASGSLKLPASDFTKEGLYTINIRAVDQAGNVSKVKTVKYYLGDASGDLNGYLPSNVKTQTYYSKNLITWEINKELSGNVYYEIHRGTTSNFIPSDSTLAADHITSTYWSDPRISEDKVFYYKIKVVKTDAKGNVLPSDVFTNAVTGIKTAKDEFNHRLGVKSYQSYHTFTTPNGSGTVEKSKGNLNYSQTDMNILNNRLMFDFTRNYNSQSLSDNMLGRGWSDTFHKELYETEGGTIIFRDSDGNTYSFIKNEDGSYQSAETKELELSVSEENLVSSNMNVQAQFLNNTDYVIQESDKSKRNAFVETTKTVIHEYVITTKNNAIYKFNQNGQIVSLTEPYGNFLLYEYDGIGRLQNIITNTGIQLNLNYYTDFNEQTGTNPYRLKSLTLPDGVIYEYSYQSGNLSKVIAKGKKGETVTYQYHYNNDNRLSEILDAKGNIYSIDYTENKVSKITSPIGDYHSFLYQGDSAAIIKYNKNAAKLYEENVILDSISGKIIESKDAAGNVTKYLYGDDRNPLLLTGTKEEIQYQELAEDGTVLHYTKEVETTTTFDEEENVITETDEEGNTTTFYYDTDNDDWSRNLPTDMRKVTADGQILFDEHYTYDESGNPIRQENKNQNIVTENTYNNNGKLQTRSVKLNQSVQSYSSIEYDEIGNEVTVLEESGSIQGETENTYDPMGRLLKSENYIASKVTIYEYDFLGRVTFIQSIAGGAQKIERMSYDDNGTLISKVNADGVTETYSYDPLNRLTDRTIAKGETLEYKTEYDYASVELKTGLGIKQIDNAYVQRNYYKNDNGEYVISSAEYIDGAGNSVRKVSNGIYTDYTYNKQGKILTEFTSGLNGNSQGKLTVNLYDEAGRQTAEILNPSVIGDTFVADANTSIVTKSTFDDAGNEVTATDANGITTFYTYDKNNRISKVNVADNSGNSYESSVTYDIVNSDNTISTLITDAMGHTSIQTVDGAGLQREVKSLGDGSASIATSFQYDKEGNKTKEIFQNGAYKKFIYNRIGLMTRTEYYTSDGEQTLATDYKYDESDQLIYMIDRKLEDGQVKPYRHTYYEYDNLGRKVGSAEINSLSEPTADDIKNKQIRYKYNSQSLLTDVIYPISNHPIKGLHYSYNEYNWLISIEAVLGTGDGAAKETVRTISYTPEGEVDQIIDHLDYMNGGELVTVKSHAYDIFGRLTGIEFSNGNGEVFESYSYEYDKNSAVIKETSLNRYPENPDDQIEETKEYTYDIKGQLIKTITTNHKDNDSVSTASYEYDKAGNRTSMSINGETTTYTYNGLDQLTGSVTSKGTEIISNTIYSYDASGNQIKSEDSLSGTVIGYQYDEGSRLSQVTVYANGKMVSKQENLYNGDGLRVSKSEDTKQVNYFYSDGAVLYTMDQDGTQSINFHDLEGNIISTAKYGLDKLSNFTYNTNKDGSTTNLLNQDGNTQVSYIYSDFGEIHKSGNKELDNEYTYKNSIYDEFTGLYYTNARYYNPEDGRYLTQNIITGEKYNLNTDNLYVYTSNQPNNYTEPSSRAATMVLKPPRQDTLKMMMAAGTWVIPLIGKILITTAGQIVVGVIVGAIIAWLLYKIVSYIAKVIQKVLSNAKTYQFTTDKKNHILQPKHNWNKLVPNPKDPKNWPKIEAIIVSVMASGRAEPYKSVMKKVMTIGGHVVEVTYKIINGVARISDAWIK